MWFMRSISVIHTSFTNKQILEPLYILVLASAIFVTKYATSDYIIIGFSINYYLSLPFDWRSSIKSFVVYHLNMINIISKNI